MESLVKEGVRKKGQKLFLCVLSKEKKNLHFFIQKKNGPLCCSFWRTLWEKHGGNARSFCSSFNVSISCFISGCFEVIFFHRHHSLSRLLTCSSLLTAPRECTVAPERAGREKVRKRDTQGEWSMQKRYNLQSGKADGPCRWFTTWKKQHTHRGITTQSKQKTGTVFYVTFLPSWFIFFVLSGMWF